MAVTIGHHLPRSVCRGWRPPPTEPLRRGGAVETAALVEQAVSGVQLSAPPGYEVIEHNTPAGRRYFTYRTGNMTFRSRREAWRFFDGEVGREDVDPDANSDADGAADEPNEHADLWSHAEEPAEEAPAAAADGGGGLLGASGAQISTVFASVGGGDAADDPRAVECDVEAPAPLPFGTARYHVPDMQVCDTPGCALPAGHGLAHSFELVLAGRRRPPSRATGIELLRSPSHPTADD